MDKLGLLGRVRVIHGRAEEVLPALEEPYDAVFVDGGRPRLDEEVVRLTRLEGAPPGFKQELRQTLIDVLERLKDRLEAGADEDHVALAEARRTYVDAVRATVRGSDA